MALLKAFLRYGLPVYVVIFGLDFIFSDGVDAKTLLAGGVVAVLLAFVGMKLNEPTKHPSIERGEKR